MLEKIKKLLDSGCWVEVEIEKNPTTGLNQLVKILGYNDIHEKIILFTEYGMLLYGYGEDSLIGDWDFIHINFDRMYLKNNGTKILSIKPIARPLYNYKVGDRVVVLDNYEGENFEIGKEYEVSFLNGVIYMTGKYSEPIDIRCIAPVLD